MVGIREGEHQNKGGKPQFRPQGVEKEGGASTLGLPPEQGQNR